MFAIEELPVEIIDKIFAQLDHKDLLKCSKVCRLFHNTIASSRLLEYKIELSVAGLMDGDPDSEVFQAIDRMQQLKTVQCNWDHLQFRKREKLPRPLSRLYELVGGVAAFGGVEHSHNIRGLRFIELPSAVRGTSSRQWQYPDLGLNIRDFTMDPVQDLLLLISTPIPIGHIQPGLFEIQVHIRSMSTGSDHSAASMPVVCTRTTLPDEACGFYIRVLGDYVALLFHQRLDMAHENCEDQLHIWNWKTGAVICRLGPYASTIRIDSFLFLSERFFIVSRFEPAFNSDFTPCLEVYDFLDVKTESKEPFCIRTYELPQLHGNAIMLSMLLRSDPAPSIYGLRTLPYTRPFYIGPESRLLTVRMSTLATDGEVRFIMLFVHYSSLLEGLLSLPDTSIQPWESWGPERTRVLVNESPFNTLSWVCYVYGNRYVMAKPLSRQPTTTVRRRMSFLYVYDFNPIVIQKTVPESLKSDADEVEVARSCSLNETSIIETYPKSFPTVIESSLGLFAENISTSLPYRLIRSHEAYPFAAVMIDEDCIMAQIFEQTASGHHEESLEFLCV